MQLMKAVRSKSALIGLASAIMAAVATAGPAAAAESGKSITFTLSTNNDVTTVVACPQGTPSNIVMCGYATNTPLAASNTAGDAGLSGTITESFVSALAAPAPTADCPAAMADQSAITLQTSKGQIFVATRGSFCTVTGKDVEPFVILGGTGEYQGATGSGVVNAQQISPTAASETYQGTITLAH
jgi:hypothetical protein